MVTTISTVENAAEWTSRPHPAPLAERASLVATFAALCDEVKRVSCDVLGYAVRDVSSLWDDQQLFLRQWVDQGVEPGFTWPSAPGRPHRKAELVHRPFDCSLVSLPSNAPVPLAAILTACAAGVGSRLLITCPQSVRRIVDRLLPAELELEGVGLWTGRTRELMTALECLSAIDHVYFMGPSTVYPGLAAQCASAGAFLRFEGQGNGVAVVATDSSNALRMAVSTILEAKRFCEGRMCSAPTGVVVCQDQYPEFVAMWAEVASEFELVGPLDTSVSQPAWRSLCDEVTPGWSTSKRPGLCPVTDMSDALALPEAFSPVLWALPVATPQEVQDLLERSPYRLQVSYFGSDYEWWSAIRAVRFARYCRNMNPSDQDPLLPWGNFRASGESRVEGFQHKFLTPVLVEETRQ